MFLVGRPSSFYQRRICIANDNAFRVCFSDPEQGTLSADYIVENSLAAKVAVIYDSSDPYSSGIHDAFVTEAQEKGLEIVSDEAFTADSNKDFTVQIQKAQSAGAELVFLPIYYTEASLILTQADKIGYEPVFLAATVWTVWCLWRTSTRVWPRMSC